MRLTNIFTKCYIGFGLKIELCMQYYKKHLSSLQLTNFICSLKFKRNFSVFQSSKTLQLKNTNNFKNKSALLFNIGCNDQVFPPKPWRKILHRSVLSSLRKMQKLLTLTHSIPQKKMTSSSQRLLPAVITS